MRAPLPERDRALLPRPRAWRKSLAIFGFLVLLLGFAVVSTSDENEYRDPWGLPSGSAVLKFATQEDILTGEHVQGFDFATGSVVDTTYAAIVAMGEVDLIYFELSGDSLFRAPEDALGYDQAFIDSVGFGLELEEIADMLDEELQVFAPAESGLAYVMLQHQSGPPELQTAVKLKVSTRADSFVHFDWVWQPNGSLVFIPVASETSSFGELKSRYAP